MKNRATILTLEKLNNTSVCTFVSQWQSVVGVILTSNLTEHHSPRRNYSHAPVFISWIFSEFL